MDEGDMYIQNIYYFIAFILSVHEHRGWYEELVLDIPQLFFLLFFNPVFACIYFFLLWRESVVLNTFYTAECMKNVFF
jgi:hypothetical protein